RAVRTPSSSSAITPTSPPRSRERSARHRGTRRSPRRGTKARTARYFVTGATGFVGGALARQLRSSGHDVVALVRRPSEALAALGVDQRTGDITDQSRVRSAMAGVDGVFHAAAWYRIGAVDARE